MKPEKFLRKLVKFIKLSIIFIFGIIDMWARSFFNGANPYEVPEKRKPEK